MLLGTTLLAGTAAFAQDVTLTIESWRNDDLRDLAGEDHPGLRGEPPGHQAQLHALGADRVQRRAELQARRRLGGRPHHLPAVRRQRSSSSTRASSPTSPTSRRWRTSPTSPSPAGRPTTASTTFCVPMASRHPRLHLQQGTPSTSSGSTAPKTEAEFFAAARQDQGGRHLHPDGDGHQRPVGSRDHGLPEHRPELLEGRGGPAGADQGRAEADRRRSGSRPSPQLAKWKDYLGDGFEAQTYPDSQNLFTLGRAAIYPAGSWEIAPFEAQIQGAFEMGAFPPPVPNAGDECYISDHVDIAIGMNAATRRTPRRPRPSSSGSAPPSSPSSTPTRCPASSRCRPRR